RTYPNKKMVSQRLPLRTTTTRLVSEAQFLYGLLYGLVDFFIPESWKHWDISGQVVLINGGGSGIGQLMALKFAKLNAKVVIWDVNQAGMETTVEMFREAKLNPEKSCFCYRVNICDRKSVYDMAKRVQ